MEHLTIEEIIKYVTASRVDGETLKLLSKANGHIRNCTLCKEKIDSYETINDELKKEVPENGFDLNHVDDLIKIKKNISIEHY